MTSPYQGFYHHQQDHQQSTTVLVLGILGLVLCQVLSPVAWVMGNRVVREIDASEGRLGGRSTANAGRVCGIVGSILLGLSLALLLLVLVLFLASPASFDDDQYDPSYGAGLLGTAAVVG